MLTIVKSVAPLVYVAFGIDGKFDGFVELKQYVAKPVYRCRVVTVVRRLAVVRRRLIVFDGRQPTIIFDGVDERGDRVGVRCKD